MKMFTMQTAVEERWTSVPGFQEWYSDAIYGRRFREHEGVRGQAYDRGYQIRQQEKMALYRFIRDKGFEGPITREIEANYQWERAGGHKVPRGWDKVEGLPTRAEMKANASHYEWVSACGPRPHSEAHELQTKEANNDTTRCAHWDYRWNLIERMNNCLLENGYRPIWEEKTEDMQKLVAPPPMNTKKAVEQILDAAYRRYKWVSTKNKDQMECQWRKHGVAQIGHVATWSGGICRPGAPRDPIMTDNARKLWAEARQRRLIGGSDFPVWAKTKPSNHNWPLEPPADYVARVKADCPNNWRSMVAAYGKTRSKFDDPRQYRSYVSFKSEWMVWVSACGARRRIAKPQRLQKRDDKAFAPPSRPWPTDKWSLSNGWHST
jgi:hypothetical protein